MMCKECNYKNPGQAWYCYKCGKEFTEKEREEAYNRGLVGLIKKGKSLYEKLNLSFITSDIRFRILSIILVLAVGIWGIITNGYKLKINESDNYTYEYNKEQNEYYLYTKENETKVDLYLIGDTTSMNVLYYDENDNLISDDIYNIEDIVLSTNIIKDCYYVLKTENESIRVYVYKDNIS